MTVVYERIYIRFKGRVLGPLSHDRVVELVRRGQITREHDMSSDGVHWAKAGDFTEFFPATTTKPVGETISTKNSDATDTATQWYVNFDDETPQCYDEPTIDEFVRTGKINKETPIWQVGMSAWQAAGQVMPQWFAKAKTQQQNGEAATENVRSTTWENLTTELIRSKAWVQLLAITGLIGSAIAFIGFSVCLLAIAFSDYAIGLKLCISIAMLGQTVLACAWAFCFYKFIRYSALLTAVKFRGGAETIQAAMVGLSAAWRFTSVIGLIWISVSLISLVIVGIVWSIDPDAGYDLYSSLDSRRFARTI